MDDEMSQQFRGPLGLWPFPIVNMILQMLQQRSTATTQRVPQRTHNIEKWEWTDYKGNKREFTIHREVTSE